MVEPVVAEPGCGTGAGGGGASWHLPGLFWLRWVCVLAGGEHVFALHRWRVTKGQKGAHVEQFTIHYDVSHLRREWAFTATETFDLMKILTKLKMSTVQITSEQMRRGEERNSEELAGVLHSLCRLSMLNKVNLKNWHLVWPNIFSEFICIYPT